MKGPSRTMVQRVVQGHRRSQTRVSREAAPLVYLHYLLFMKKLATSCDKNAFRYRRVQITEADVLKVADGLLGAFSDAQRVRKQALQDGSVLKKQAAKVNPESVYDLSFESEEESDELQTRSMT